MTLVNVCEIYRLRHRKDIAFFSYRYGGQCIVPSGHYCSNLAIIQCLDCFDRSAFQFVLHHQEPNELKIPFDFVSLSFLNL